MQNSNHWRVELCKKQNFNEKGTLYGICLQQILVPSRVTNLDFHDKIDTWDLTYLHTDSQMFRVYHEEALVAVKKLDENEINLETCENHAREVRCGWLTLCNVLLSSNLKGIYWLMKVDFEVFQMSRFRWAVYKLKLSWNQNFLSLISFNQWHSASLDKNVLFRRRAKKGDKFHSLIWNSAGTHNGGQSEAQW